MKLSELLKVLEEQRQHEQQLAILKKKLTNDKKIAPEKKAQQEESENNNEENSEEIIENKPNEETLEEKIPEERNNREEKYTPFEVTNTTSYRKTNITDTYSLMNDPSAEHLANTFIKEGLITLNQAVTPDQNEAILKRLQELHPGASIETILKEHQTLLHPQKKREDGNVR